jgi:predicted NBD/HSP70 family sugar kinase
MKYFAGLDVSLEETAICVVDEGGEIIKEMRSESEPEALVSALLNMRLDFDRIGWRPVR